jgi:hypothetical protein
MDHDIIHHTESIPTREPMTRDQAVKVINNVTEEFELEDWQKATLLGLLTSTGPVVLSRARPQGKTRIRQAYDRIEEARAHGLA